MSINYAQLVANVTISALELYTRLKMQNPSQHTDKDEKIAAMSEWIIRNRKKPSDYLQYWRPEE